MPETPPSNVKIYDRPEKTGPSPLVIVIGLLIVLVAAFFMYKMFYHPTPTTNTTSDSKATGYLMPLSGPWHNKGLQLT